MYTFSLGRFRYRHSFEMCISVSTVTRNCICKPKYFLLPVSSGFRHAFACYLHAFKRGNIRYGIYTKVHIYISTHLTQTTLYVIVYYMCICRPAVAMISSLSFPALDSVAPQGGGAGRVGWWAPRRSGQIKKVRAWCRARSFGAVPRLWSPSALMRTDRTRGCTRGWHFCRLFLIPADKKER